MTDPILLVEDDFDVRDALAQVLEDSGYRVAAASNGLEALALLRAGLRPAAILLDLWMPDLDGAHFRQEQLRDPELAAIPVVVVSADRAVERKAQEIGAAAFLPKPAHVADVLRTLSRFAAPSAGVAAGGA
jgi:CheY-like chemotaxis protein